MVCCRRSSASPLNSYYVAGEALVALMLARITTATAHLVNVCFDSSALSTQENEDGEHALVIDLEALRSLLPSAKDNLWSPVMACGRVIAPLCSNLQQALSSDLENIAQLLHDLESRHEESFQNILPVGLLNDNEKVEIVEKMERSNEILCPKLLMGDRPPRKRRRSSQTKQNIIIHSTHPSTPSIIITLAPPQRRERSSCIPYQDNAFGNLLPVPSHPVFNKIYPPMSLESSFLPNIDDWEWRNGRWVAILPSLEEQHRRGLFSKPISSKKKPCRSLVCSGSKGRHCR
uniref:Uncharacterized protein n=1 Tax=Psilocybe cubensis TaxID=181762 RepID=A0A8H8CQC1_PSICU